MKVVTNAAWLIVGPSSPIAKAFIRHVAEINGELILAGRDTYEVEVIAADARIRGAKSAVVVHCDVGDEQSCYQMITFLHESQANLNCFISVGENLDREILELDPLSIARMIRTNLIGPVLILELLKPIFKRQGFGSIVILGSVAGDRGRKSNYEYGCTKAAIATFLEGFRSELYSSNTSVILVKPGFIDTQMTWGRKGVRFAASPQKCAKAVANAIEMRRDIIYFPAFWRLIMLVIRLIPSFIFKKMTI
jgi:short-subunit dehydrogenase